MEEDLTGRQYDESTTQGDTAMQEPCITADSQDDDSKPAATPDLPATGPTPQDYQDNIEDSMQALMNDGTTTVSVPLSHTYAASTLNSPRRILAADLPKSPPPLHRAVDSDQEEESVDDEPSLHRVRLPAARDISRTSIRPHMLRYTLAMTVDPADRADLEMCTVGAKWFKKILEMDKTAALYPYYDKDCVEGQRTHKTIRRADDVPKSVGVFQRYFHEAYPRFKGGKVWTAVFLGTTKTLDELIKEGLWWFEQYGYQLWNRQLQCESTIIVGWAIGSLPHMNEQPIRDAIKRELGLNVGLRW